MIFWGVVNIRWPQPFPTMGPTCSVYICNIVCTLKWASNVQLTSPNCRHWSIAVRDPVDNSASLTSWGMGRPESEGQAVGRGETKGEALTSCSLRRGPVGWVWRSWDGGRNEDTSLQQWGALLKGNTPTGRHVLAASERVPLANTDVTPLNWSQPASIKLQSCCKKQNGMFWVMQVQLE